MAVNDLGLNYCAILKEELIPALGCTEPIAIAYASAVCRRILSCMPDSVTVMASGNIIKNVKDDVSVKATGAVYTAIEQVEGVKVYTANGILYIETPSRIPVTIVNLTGVVIRNEESIGMKQYNNLNSGVYIVRVGNRIFKVRIG